MKLYILPTVVMLFCGHAICGYSQSIQDGFSSTLNHEWLKGNKMAVKKIAEDRIKRHLDDLASQLILFDYASTYMDTDALTKLIPVIRKTSDGVKSPNFMKQKDLLVLTLDICEDLIPSVTNEMRLVEKHKGDIKGKQLSTLAMIQALEMDNLVAALNESEKRELSDFSKKSRRKER